jgi:hypothetical protein
MFDVDTNIGEGSADLFDNGLDVIRAAFAWTVIARIVEDEMGSENLVHCVQISFVNDLLEKTSNNSLVFFC